jgi:hypothetical protein
MMPDRTLAHRRDLLIAPLFAALPSGLAGAARADTLNPEWTILRSPERIRWQSRPDYPPRSVESAPLFGSTDEPGLYYVLVKWHPGYMSAPHSYVTDRLCVVVSGTWWINSGADFEPANTVPAPAGSFVRRVAGTPHYDGVKPDGTEPAVIAICGIGPVGRQWVDPSKPGWRKL